MGLMAIRWRVLVYRQFCSSGPHRGIVTGWRLDSTKSHAICSNYGQLRRVTTFFFCITPQVPCFILYFLWTFSSSLSPIPPFVPSYRMQINSTRASCLSSPPWLPSTLRLRVAATGEARKTKGTLEGLNPLPRKSCSHAGKKRQTTAPSPPSSGLLIAPAIQGRGTITAGPGLRPQSNLFLFFRGIFFKSYILISETMSSTWSYSDKLVESNFGAYLLASTLLSWSKIINSWGDCNAKWPS